MRRSLSAKNVLVVEDRPELALMFADALRAVGADVVIANDAIEALTALRRQRVDAVVSDLKMPGLSGFDLMKIVRSSENAFVRSVPAVAVSGEAEWRFQDPFEAAHAGFDFHLVKPVMPETLVEAVDRVMRWRKRPTV